MTTESDNLAPEKPRRGRPPKQNSGVEATRERLIERGIQIFTEKGFNNTGLDEILKSENVPKGSFYHYFKNKAQYGEVVVEAYAVYFGKKLARNFTNTSLAPLQRLQAFIDEACHGIEKYSFKRGCLVGNLGQELGALDATFRTQLEGVFQEWQQQLAELLDEAKQQGELATQASTSELAEFFWIGWEGAILRAKLVQSDQPIRAFAKQFFVICKVGL